MHEERHRHERLGDDDPGGGERQRDPERGVQPLPTRPCRPRTSSSATPPTTGGSTTGTVTRARTRRGRGRKRGPAATPAAPRRGGRTGWRGGADHGQSQRLQDLRPAEPGAESTMGADEQSGDGQDQEGDPDDRGQHEHPGSPAVHDLRTDVRTGWADHTRIVHDDVGGLDDGDRDHARFESEVVGGLAAHQRHEAERSREDLDLGHHAVAYDVGHAEHPVARGGQDGVGLGGERTKAARSTPEIIRWPCSSRSAVSRPESTHRRTVSELTPRREATSLIRNTVTAESISLAEAEHLP